MDKIVYSDFKLKLPDVYLSQRSFFLISNRHRYLFFFLFPLVTWKGGLRVKEEIEIIYLCSFVEDWNGFEVMVDSLADGRTWIKGASRGEWKSETAGIDKTAVPLFFSIDLSTWLRQWTVAQVIWCYSIKHASVCAMFPVTLVLFNSFHFGNWCQYCPRCPICKFLSLSLSYLCFS